LVVARNGSLSVSVHPRLDYFSSGVVVSRHGNWSPVVGTPYLKHLTRYRLLRDRYFAHLTTVTPDILPIRRARVDATIPAAGTRILVPKKTRSLFTKQPQLF
jgi:hypothetical protein